MRNMYSKQSLNLAGGLLLAFVIFSCAAKKEGHDHEHHAGSEHMAEWKEMDDFHMIMAETFHPYKDSANLEPARTRASELLTAAEQWLKAPLPEKVDNEEMKSKLQQLKSEAQTLAESVKSADENTIAGHLTRVHDTFHAIQEAWYGGH